MPAINSRYTIVFEIPSAHHSIPPSSSNTIVKLLLTTLIFPVIPFNLYSHSKSHLFTTPSRLPAHHSIPPSTPTARTYNKSRPVISSSLEILGCNTNSHPFKIPPIQNPHPFTNPSMPEYSICVIDLRYENIHSYILSSHPYHPYHPYHKHE